MAGVFKVARCSICGYNKAVAKPKKYPCPCPNCGGAIYLRLSDNWYIRYQVAGKKVVKAISPRKDEAEIARGKIKAEIRERRHFDMAPSTPWHKAVEQFKTWAEVNTGPHTTRMYLGSLKNLEPYFREYALDQITAPMVEQFKARRTLEVTNSTVNRALATLKRLMSLSELWGLLEINRVQKVKLLKENKARIRCLTNKEMGALLDICRDGYEDKGRKLKMKPNPTLYLAVKVALNTGLRKEGVLGLKWSDISLVDGIISRAVKGGTVVHIPITHSLRVALLDAKKGKVLSQYVLPSPRNPGKPIKDVKKGFSYALRCARINDFRFHDLRHTFATRFLRKTKDFRALQELLGHADYKMTMRYSHVLDEHKVEAMKVFDNGDLQGATK